jgi:hypothetical protein
VTRSALFALFAGSLLLFSTGSPAAPADPPAKADPKKPDGFEGRTKEGKARLLKEFGGSPEGEEAVMLGLAWLTQMQKPAGNWVYDVGMYTNDLAAATGMAMLAFTGAGQSHKDGRYKQTVQAGLDWLVKDVNMTPGPAYGKFKSSTNMYSQGIAALALCEVYGMTHDPALKKTAQAVIDYIQKGQGPRGSWGYAAGTDNDTSILGWQIQALHAARLTQDLKVDDKVIKKAIQFLNSVSPGQTKSTYGYSDTSNTAPATALTAIGLLCRYYVDGWRSETTGFAEGSKGLLKAAVVERRPLANGVPGPNPGGASAPLSNMYYYYYATQVVRFYGGEEWKTWNEGPLGADGKRRGGLADWLLSLQVRTPTNRGSWDPEAGWFGGNCGRLGTTCMCLLTLEVYYRYAPEEDAKAPKKP